MFGLIGRRIVAHFLFLILRMRRAIILGGQGTEAVNVRVLPRDLTKILSANRLELQGLMKIDSHEEFLR